MIISVPHSGSRTLLRHVYGTGNTEYLWHFGDHDALIASYEGTAHIPLRDPVSTISSWLSRNRDPDDLLKRYSLLVAYKRERGPEARVYPMETLTTSRVGHREYPKKYPGLANRIVLLLPSEVKEFYREYGYQV